MLRKVCILTVAAIAFSVSLRPASGNSGDGDASSQAGFGHGPFIAGIGGTTAGNSVLRFVNESSAAGTITLTLYDASTGTQLSTWTSASVAAGAGLQVTAAQVIAAASPVLSAAEQVSVLNATATATFRGDYQLLTLTGTSILNQSTCGEEGDLGYVEGPGFANVIGAVQVLNPSATAGTITLNVSDASTGTKLGTWTSPSVPPYGSVTVTSAALSAAASPVVPASTVALNVTASASTARLRMQHVATVSGQTVASNLSAACPL